MGTSLYTVAVFLSLLSTVFSASAVLTNQTRAPVESCSKWCLRSNGDAYCCSTKECDPACQNGGTCNDQQQCDCTPGWIGETCDIRECTPACQNGGMCNARRQCDCAPGWIGAACEIRVSECNPACQNGGTCNSRRQCDCAPGWIGAACDIRESECTPACENGGSCNARRQCDCEPGWIGAACDIRECNPACQNGGTCNAEQKCECAAGWGGETCGIRAIEPVNDTMPPSGCLLCPIDLRTWDDCLPGAPKGCKAHCDCPKGQLCCYDRCIGYVCKPGIKHICD